mgnify:FL=1
MTPLLEGLDGVKKMSKSLGNYIGIQEAPEEIFGKIMSVSDELMLRYYEILTDRDVEAVKKLHPKEAKLVLAQQIVTLFYSSKEAVTAREEFERVFSRGEIPGEIAEYRIHDGQVILDVVVEAKMAASKNEARRLIKQGAVALDGRRIQDEEEKVSSGILKVGKRRFVKLI